MKKTIYILIAGLLIVSACKSKKAATAAATDTTEEVRKAAPRNGGGSLDQSTVKQEEMYTQLGISDTQKEQFRIIESKYAAKLRDARSGGQDAMKSVMDAKTAEVGTILTAAQLTQYKEMLLQMRENRGGPRGGGR